MDLSPPQTLIACLTPPGTAAIATLAVRGPRAWPITRSLFRGRLPENPVPGQFYLGRLGEDKGACDDVVLAVKPDHLELHCHGGLEVVRFIEDLFTRQGANTASGYDLIAPTESRLRRLARQQLTQAPTAKTAAILLDQFHGAFENALVNVLKAVDGQDSETVQRHLISLARTQRLGRHLVDPFRVAVAGAPNAGKSSLVNALAGYTRSIVSATPGTTRDLVTTRIALEGWPVELIDTAGIREGGDDLEREGMMRARAVLDGANLRLWVLDAAAEPVMPPADISVDLMVINKVDLPRAWKETALCQLSASRSVSAKTGHGMGELGQAIATALGLHEVPVSGEGVAFTPELCDKVLQARAAMQQDATWSTMRGLVEELLY
jgi:tRNA modification GTPase